MRFNPVYFIQLCEHSGFSLTRKADLLCYSFNPKQPAINKLFVAAMKEHKAELLPFLEEENGYMQLDLFDTNQLPE